MNRWQRHGSRGWQVCRLSPPAALRWRKNRGREMHRGDLIAGLRDQFCDGARRSATARGAWFAPFLRSKLSTEAKVTFSLGQRDCGDQLSTSSTDAPRRAVKTSNVPIHLQAGEPLDIAGQVACRVYTLLPVDWGIFRPAINHLLTGFLFLFQTGFKGRADI